jgi:hypothetical protein
LQEGDFKEETRRPHPSHRQVVYVAPLNGAPYREEEHNTGFWLERWALVLEKKWAAGLEQEKGCLSPPQTFYFKFYLKLDEGRGFSKDSKLTKIKLNS